MTDTSCFGACCGCTCYGCTDCEFCKKGAACTYPDSTCCYCAPECYYVLIAGMTVNDDRHCVDCCYEFGGSTSVPCPNGDCCQNCGDPWNGCSRLPNCEGTCGGRITPDGTTCTFGNGTIILKGSSGSCYWYGGPKTEPGEHAPITTCCDTSIRPVCECIINGTHPLDPGITCCCCNVTPSNPSCCAGNYCTVDEDPCTTCWGASPPYSCSMSVDDCVAQWCGDDFVPEEGYSPCSDDGGNIGECNAPFQLVVQANLTYLDPCTVELTVYVSYGPNTWTFKKDWYFCCDPLYPPEWQICLPYWCAIDCSVLTADWVPSLGPGRAPWCNWLPGSIALIGVTCPPPLFWEAKSLYYQKNDGVKYLNLSELRRRKWLRSIGKKMEKISNQLIKLEKEVTPELVFGMAKKSEDAKLFRVKGDDNEHPIITAQYKKVQRMMFMRQKGSEGKIRKENEIVEIFENSCSKCPYYSDDGGFCMLNDYKVSTRPEVFNFLMDGDAECPDFPPRWGPTSDPYKEVEQPKIL